MSEVQQLKSFVATFREANQANSADAQVANEARIAALDSAIDIVAPFLA